jgi:hypothetical protein
MSTNNTYIVTGTLTDDHPVTLDEALPLTLMPMKVHLSRPRDLTTGPCTAV